jgi:hypothetical protein
MLRLAIHGTYINLILLLALISIKHYGCVCILPLGIQHENRIFNVQYYIVICGLSGCMVIPFFSTLSNKDKIFGRNMQ